MKEGSYLEPLNPIEHPAKIAVVIGTFIRKGKIEHVGGRKRIFQNPEDEYIEFDENKLELVKFNLSCHKHYKAGIDYDIIIVDNSTDDEESIKWIRDYCNKNKITLLERPNTGFSFGAYNHAWKTFGRKYDYYLFCEQDIIPCKDNWLSEILLKYMSDRHIGAIGNIVEGYRSQDYFTNWGAFKKEYIGDYWDVEHFRQCNLDGMFMFTSSRILEECGLQIYEMEMLDDYEKWTITPGINELFWQNNILNAGYKLDSFDDNKHLNTWGITYVDFEKEGEYPPLIHGQTIYCNEKMKEHFKWYTNLQIK